jgi:hypothetical protein
VKWLLRFIGWATVFAVPCFLLSHPWQGVLGALAVRIVSLFGIQIEMQEVQVMAPFDLGIYLAMCLASRNAPALERRRAMERGGLIVLLLELLTVVGAVLVFFAIGSGGEQSSSALRFSEYLIEFVPWASATVIWLAWLGRWELPATVTDTR